ncbi:hypothetical protein Bca52824_023719 [Brassica carinata]|uniref:Uncharacterized protein n=1 Tax=Brassica carinata TaxID=52824 RepID=A0A8X8AVZ5_BRACI|nr:hypothetical protein Bca52824_023719 [Brassica carinata]
MGQLVWLVVGDWERGGPGLWKFYVDHTRVKYDVIMKENETYSSVMGIVRSKYKLDQLLLPTEPVLLTYDFPEYTTATGDYTSPPVETLNDSDVEMFMEGWNKGDWKCMSPSATEIFFSITVNGGRKTDSKKMR